MGVYCIDVTGTIFLLLVIVLLLFEGDYYSRAAFNFLESSQTSMTAG